MKQGKLINIFKKEDGAGLVLALMVLMVLAVLGVAVAGVTIGSYKLGHISRDSNSAYYIAEAGANLAYADIKNGVMGAYENSANSELNYFTKITERVRAVNGREYQEFSDQFGDKPTATIKIEPEPANDVKKYTIVSTGEINGTSRTVRKPFTVNWVNKNSGIGLPPLPDDCALYINEMMIPLLVKVYGDIRINPEHFSEFLKYVVNGLVEHYTVDGKVNDIIYESIDMEPYRKIKFPSLPVDYKEYEKKPTINTSTTDTIDQSLCIDNLTIGKLPSFLDSSRGSPLTIDTGNEGRTINLVVKNLYVYNDIKIIGDGTVNLYVANSMEFASTSKGLMVGGARVDQLNILYSGSEKQTAYMGKLGFSNNKNIVFTGTIFLEQANMWFYNNVELEGIIVTFGSELNMYYYIDVTAVIYAPNSTVTMYGGSKLKGGLVANKVKFYGGLLTDPNEVQYSPLEEYVKKYLFGTGTGETPTLDKLISSQAAIEP